MLMTPRQRLRHFLRAGDGSATVEFTMIVPAFLGFVLFAADASTSFTRQSTLWNVSQQTARIVARHALDAEGGARYAQDQLSFGATPPEVVVTIDAATQMVTVVVTVETAAMAPFGILQFALQDRMSVSVSQALEPI